MDYSRATKLESSGSEKRGEEKKNGWEMEMGKEDKIKGKEKGLLSSFKRD